MFVVFNYGANLKVEEKEQNDDWLVKEETNVGWGSARHVFWKNESLFSIID